MEITERKVYTVQEVAVMLGISKSYVYELAKLKKIPTMELGGRIIISKKKFDQWLDGKTEES